MDGDDLCAGQAVLARRSKMLAASVVGGRAFYDAYASQRVPVVRWEPSGNLVQILGGSGSGVRLAPALATKALALLEA